MARLAKAYGWGPDYYLTLTEAQVYGYASRISVIEKYEAEVQAVVMADRLALSLASLLFGGKKR